MTYDLLRLLQIALASFWLAATVKDLFDPMQEQTGIAEFKERLKKRKKAVGALGITSGMGTLLSSAVLLWITGVSDHSRALYAGICVAVIMALIGTFGIGGSFHKAIAAFDEEDGAAKVREHLGKLRTWSVAMLALWLITFLLMGLRHHI